MGKLLSGAKAPLDRWGYDAAEAAPLQNDSGHTTKQRRFKAKARTSNNEMRGSFTAFRMTTFLLSS